MPRQSSTKAIGDKGEDVAVQFLESKGYTVLEQNWRTSTLEVDIICKTNDTLVFVEVKYRRDTRFGDPVEFISDQKMENLSLAAGRYLGEYNWKGSVRFDVIGIRPSQRNHYRIRHLIDVHYPGWDP